MAITGEKITRTRLETITSNMRFDMGSRAGLILGLTISGLYQILSLDYNFAKIDMSPGEAHAAEHQHPILRRLTLHRPGCQFGNRPAHVL